MTTLRLHIVTSTGCTLAASHPHLLPVELVGILADLPSR
jgi:hypothetical protein